jgi:DNA polymerase-1
MKVSEAIAARFAHILAPYIKEGKLSLGKLIKSCFVAPPGWIFAGLDFDSLEDRISALTTKDPNKLKVYTDGYDGHCLRAYSYFGYRMEGIDPNSVVSINSIAKAYPVERQESKVPTFLLTYGGTWKGIVEQTGLNKEQAIEIETRYHELYKVSDQWIWDKIQEATKTGYVTVAFGLRVRTPLLKQVIRGNRKTPYEAEAEARSAGNAFGQSWCLLNSRAGSEFMGKVRKSAYRLDIRPCSQIHDAGYFLIRDCMEPLLYTNEHLVKAVRWQEHPDIAHPQVKLGGALSIFYPDWSKEIEIANDATEQEITETIAKAVA